MPTNQPLHDDDTSGRVEFLDGGIVCFPKHGPSVSIPLADLKVVGEYTTACGPFVDDYWLVFVLRNGSWVESSFYAAGRDRLLQGLGQALDCTLRPQLASSTSLASNVLWPPAITGEHLFEFSPAPRSGAGGAGLQLAGAQQMNAVLTMAVAGQLVQR